MADLSIAVWSIMNGHLRNSNGGAGPAYLAQQARRLRGARLFDGLCL
ncbi:hypothetical protein Z949_718 [Sulfitobacter guttiformis KCTC 32187]|nr:hypothetical protein Z949_718 [Sulfitobacter guttiformis KCTC 32187]